MVAAVAVIEVKAISVLSVTLGGRRTPIVASPTAEEVVSITRQKDAVAVRSGDLIAIYVIISCNRPDTLIGKFIKFLFCRQAPAFAPAGRGRFIMGIAGNIIQIYAICNSGFFCIFRLRLNLPPGIVVTAL